MLFMGVVVGNIAIGIFQEIRSKISVDKLTILSEKKISVLREGKIIETSIVNKNSKVDSIINYEVFE